MKISRGYRLGRQYRRNDDAPVLLEDLDIVTDTNMEGVQRLLAEGYPLVLGHFRDLELLRITTYKLFVRSMRLSRL